MAIKRVQLNNGPAMVDLINIVQGNDLYFQITMDHDITDSTFEACILSNLDEVLAAFSVSGVAPLTSGVIDFIMTASGTSLIAEGSTWYFDEITTNGRSTILAGNVELYYK